MKPEKENIKPVPLWSIPVKLTHQFSQEGGSCSTDCQLLTVETEDAGDGVYLVLSTIRWAIDPEDIEQFAEMLRRCLKGETWHRDFFNED